MKISRFKPNLRPAVILAIAVSGVGLGAAPAAKANPAGKALIMKGVVEFNHEMKTKGVEGEGSHPALL